MRMQHEDGGERNEGANFSPLTSAKYRTKMWPVPGSILLARFLLAFNITTNALDITKMNTMSIANVSSLKNMAMRLSRRGLEWSAGILGPSATSYGISFYPIDLHQPRGLQRRRECAEAHVGQRPPCWQCNHHLGILLGIFLPHSDPIYVAHCTPGEHIYDRPISL